MQGITGQTDKEQQCQVEQPKKRFAQEDITAARDLQVALKQPQANTHSL